MILMGLRKIAACAFVLLSLKAADAAQHAFARATVGETALAQAAVERPVPAQARSKSWVSSGASLIMPPASTA